MTMAAVLRRTLPGIEPRAALEFEGRVVSDWVPVGAWTEQDGLLAAVVTFGPFPNRVEVDAVLVETEGEPDRIPIPDGAGIPAGGPFDVTIVVRVG